MNSSYQTKPEPTNSMEDGKTDPETDQERLRSACSETGSVRRSKEHTKLGS